MAVAETFVHSYPSTGSRNVTAEITLSDQASDSRATTVNVVVPRLLVEYTLLAGQPIAIVPTNCYAIGPPYAPPGVSFILALQDTHRETFGLFDSGSTVSMSQDFRQDSFPMASTCFFGVTLFVGPSIIVQGFCGTTPAAPTCTINVQGTVP